MICQGQQRVVWAAEHRALLHTCSLLSPGSARARWQLLCLASQGIKEGFDKKKILKALKKEYCCNGTVVEDEELGYIIQVQGDQRKNIADFLTNVRTIPWLAGSRFGAAVSWSDAWSESLLSFARHLRSTCRDHHNVRDADELRCVLQNKIVKKDMIKVHGF